MIGGGYISLQSESHPVEFRKVELRRLDGPVPSENSIRRRCSVAAFQRGRQGPW